MKQVVRKNIVIIFLCVLFFALGSHSRGTEKNFHAHAASVPVLNVSKADVETAEKLNDYLISKWLFQDGCTN